MSRARLRAHGGTLTVRPPRSLLAAVATLAIAASALGVPHNAQAQDADETRIVNSIRVTVRFDSGSYTLDESAGRTASQIGLIARTRANTLPPLTGFRVAVLTRDGTAESPDDYQRVSRRVSFGGPFGGNWVAAGNAYESRVRVPVRIAQDDLVEGDEGFRLLLQLVGREPTVAVVPADLTAPQCTADGCQSSVTIVDDDSRDATESNSGEVTIAARHDTALQGIDPLEFVVTRSGAVDESLEVSVTLSSGIVSERKLSRTVTIPAGAAAGAFSVPTDKLASGAATGDVTAAVGDSADYEVGEPSSASIRLHVGDPLVTVRFSEESYSVDEGVGVVTEARLIARTAPNVPAPSNAVHAAVGFQPGTATTPDDYTAGVLLLSFVAAGWTAEGDTFVARSAVPFTVIDDTEAEDAETLSMQLVRPPDAPDTVNFVSADGSGSECPALQGCSAGVTVLDDDGVPPEDDPVPDPVDVSDPVVVSLVHVPDGTVIPDDSTLPVGGTVLDGTTFAESDSVLFRLLLSDQHGGPAPAGADVDLSFEWTHHSPIVPTSGQISRIVLSLYRVDVWDSAVQILDNTVGNPDSTLTVRITGCERNGCVIGEPSEITVTIADDDGGPAAAPPGRPPRPAVLCPDRGHSSFDTGLKAIWEAPDFVGGAPIDSYEVRYRQRRLGDDVPVYGDWQAWPRSGAAVSATITGLDTDTGYGVQVRAVNANGPGEWSLEGTHRTGRPDDICDILDQLVESQ